VRGATAEAGYMIGLKSPNGKRLRVVTAITDGQAR
jgi:hypothetical protein